MKDQTAKLNEIEKMALRHRKAQMFLHEQQQEYEYETKTGRMKLRAVHLKLQKDASKAETARLIAEGRIEADVENLDEELTHEEKMAPIQRRVEERKNELEKVRRDHRHTKESQRLADEEVVANSELGHERAMKPKRADRDKAVKSLRDEKRTNAHDYETKKLTEDKTDAETELTALQAIEGLRKTYDDADRALKRAQKKNRNEVESTQLTRRKEDAETDLGSENTLHTQRTETATAVHGYERQRKINARIMEGTRLAQQKEAVTKDAELQHAIDQATYDLRNTQHEVHAHKRQVTGIMEQQRIQLQNAELLAEKAHLDFMSPWQSQNLALQHQTNTLQSEQQREALEKNMQHRIKMMQNEYTQLQGKGIEHTRQRELQRQIDTMAQHIKILKEQGAAAAGLRDQIYQFETTVAEVAKEAAKYGVEVPFVSRIHGRNALPSLETPSEMMEKQRQDLGVGAGNRKALEGLNAPPPMRAGLNHDAVDDVMTPKMEPGTIPQLQEPVDIDAEVQRRMAPLLAEHKTKAETAALKLIEDERNAARIQTGKDREEFEANTRANLKREFDINLAKKEKEIRDTLTKDLPTDFDARVAEVAKDTFTSWREREEPKC
jgi:hypothetical protein